jgi:hypothetical protein
VEGMNWTAVMLVSLGLVVLTGAGLVSSGLMIAGRSNAARLFAAGGLLSAALLSAVAILSFFWENDHSGISGPMKALSSLSLSLAGIGQFVAALRNLWTYAVAAGCALLSVTFLLPGVGMGPTIPLAGPRAGIAASLVLGAASLAVSTVPAVRRRLTVPGSCGGGTKLSH